MTLADEIFNCPACVDQINADGTCVETNVDGTCVNENADGECIEANVAKTCTIDNVEGNRMVWLLLETGCFYIYVFAAVAYIAWQMIQGTCETPDRYSDRSKAI